MANTIYSSKKKKEEESQGSSLSNIKEYTPQEVYKKFMMRQFNADDFVDTYNNAMKSLNTGTDWQDPMTRSTTFTTSQIYGKKLNDYVEKYKSVMPELQQYADNFNSAALNYDSNRKLQNEYLTPSAFNTARKTAEYDRKYEGSSFIDIRDARKNVTDEDELDYLNHYKNYTTKHDIDMAVGDAYKQAQSADPDRKQYWSDLIGLQKDYERNNPFDKYKSVMDSPDFEKYSSDDSDMLSNERGTASDPMRNLLRGQIPFAESLEGDERKVATYYYNKGIAEDDVDALGRPKEYLDYLKGMAYPIRKKEREEMSTELNALADDHPVGAAVLSTGYNTFMGGVNGLTDLQSYMQGMDAPSTLGNFSSAVNEANQRVSTRIGDEVGFLPKLGYDAVTQYIPNRLRQAVGYSIGAPGAVAVNAIMGLDSFSQTYNQKMYDGFTTEEALRDAFIDGIFEFGTEQIGGEWAFGVNKIAKNGVKSVLTQSGAEALEELISGVGTNVFDVINNQENSEILSKYNHFKTQGYNSSEAFWKTVADVGGQMMYEMTVAALSATPDAAIRAGQSSWTGRDVDAAKLNEAMATLPADSKVRQQYDALMNKVGDPQNLSNYAKGETFQRANNELNDNMTSLANKIERYDRKGDADNVDYYGDDYKKAWDSYNALNEAYIPKESNQKTRTQDEPVRVAQNETTQERQEIPEAANVLRDQVKPVTGEDVDSAYINRQIKKDYDSAEQKIFKDNRVEGTNVDGYKADFDILYNYVHEEGKRNLGEALSRVNTTFMTESQATKVFHELAQHEAETFQKEKAKTDAFIAQHDGKVRRGQFVDNTKGMNLSHDEKMAKLHLMGLTGMGYDIEVYKDPKSTKNGVTLEDGKIKINLAAREVKDGKIDPKLVIPTSRHERVHFIEATLPEAEWKEFARPVKEYMGKEWDSAVAEYLTQKKISKSELTPTVLKEAESEVIARFFENIDGDTKLADKFFESVPEDGLKKMVYYAKKAIKWITEKVNQWLGKTETSFIKPFIKNVTEQQMKELEDSFVEMQARALKVKQVKMQLAEQSKSNEDNSETESKYSEQLDNKSSFGDSDGKLSSEQLTDDEYSALAESNPEQARTILDEVAKEHGAITLVGYGDPTHFFHGTRRKNFTVFDISRGAGGWSGIGFYFTPREGFAREYASRDEDMFEVYLLPEKVAYAGKYEIKKDDLLKFFKDNGFSLTSDEVYTAFVYHAGESFSDKLRDFKRGGLVKRDLEEFRMLYDDRSILISLQELLLNQGVSKEDTLKKLTDAFGYDAVSSGRETVVWNPSAIKSAELITLDDDGNEIPLSERFSESKDIRYSEQFDSTNRPVAPDMQKFMSNSEARDDENRLKQYYHGTPNMGFTTFDFHINRTQSDNDKPVDGHRSYFFTDNKNIAFSYAGKKTMLNPDQPMTAMYLSALYDRYAGGRYITWNAADNVKLHEEDGKVVKTFDTVKEAQAYLYDNYFSKAAAEDDSEPGAYAVYLNCENPLIIDCNIHIDGEVDETTLWKEKGGKLSVHLNSNIGIFDRKVPAKQVESYLKEHFPNDYKEMYEDFKKLDTRECAVFNDVHVVDDFPAEWNQIPFNGKKMKSRDITRWADINGYDSVIFKNVQDTGVFGSNVESSEVVAVFNQEQIKSIYNEHPTKNKDLRYSEQLESTMANLFDMNEQAENNKQIIKSDIQRLRELYRLQGKVTQGKVFKPSQMLAVAKDLKGKANSEISEDYVAGELNGLYNKIVAQLSRDFTEGEPDNTDNIVDMCTDLAREILDKNKGTKVVFPEFKEAYKTIRDTRIRLSEKEVDAMREIYGNDWHQRTFGRFKFVKDGISLNEAINKWRQSFPWIVDEVLEKKNPSAREMVNAIGELYNLVHDSMEATEYFVDDMDVNNLAEEIYNKFWTVSTLTTVADKYEKQIKDLRYEHRKAMADLRQSRDEQLKQLRADKNEVIRQVRERGEQNLKQYKLVRDWMEAERKDNAMKKAYVDRITDTALTLQEWIQSPDGKKGKSVPEPLQQPIADLLTSIDYLSKTALGMRKGVDPRFTKADINIANKMHSLQNAMLNKESGSESMFFGIHEWLTREMGELAEQIESLIKENEDGFTLNRMNVKQLEELSQMMKIIKGAVTNFNVRLGEENKALVAEASWKDLQANKEKGSIEYKNTVSEFIRNYFEYESALPVYVFKRLGSGALDVFQELRKGYDKYVFRIVDIMNWAGAKDENGNYINIDPKKEQKWKNEVKTFYVTITPNIDEESQVMPETREVTMTVAQIMSLYCLNKREQANKHMFGKGIRVENFTVGKEFAGEKMGKPIRQRSKKSIQLTQANIDEIVATLDQYEGAKETADKIMEFMNTNCKDWVNEISMRQWLIKIANEDNYFPIETIADDKDVPEISHKSIFDMLNFGFLNSVKEDANNALVIRDIFNVFLQHSTDAAKYNTLALPTLDVYRYYSYVDPATGERMKDSITDTYGEKAIPYITELLEGLNGSIENPKGERVYNWLLRNYKTAAVGMNAQVLFLQPLAIVRAKMYLPNKYLVRGAGHIKSGYEEMLENSGIAVWKHINLGFETDVASPIGKRIMQSESKADWVRDKALAGAGAADDITWATIWNACKYEQYDKGFRGNQLIKATTDRFEEIIYYTQVVDSPLTRTQQMRRKSFILKVATSFLSEAMVTINMNVDAAASYDADYRKAIHKGASKQVARQEAFKKNGETIKKTVYITVLSKALEALVRATWGKVRKPDEEEEYLEKLWKEFLENLNPMSDIPLLRDALSYSKGYDVSRSELEFIKNGVDAYAKWKKICAEESDLDYKTIYKTLQSISQLTGIPLSGLARDAVALWNLTVGNVYPSLQIK